MKYACAIPRGFTGKGARKGYQTYFNHFGRWLGSQREVLTVERAEVLLLDYADVLMEEKEPVRKFEKTVAAVVAEMAGLSRKDMLRLTTALSGYRKGFPPKSRLPIPDELASAIAVVMKARNHAESALAVITSQRGYSRPGERRKILVKDLVAPAGGEGVGLNSWSIIVALEEDLVLSKTQTFDDTVLMDYPLWLGPALGALAKGKAPEEPLFALTPEALAKDWKEALLTLGVPGMVQYQLRHGGASADLLSRRRSMGEVMVRGRWQSLKSLRRYAKPGQIAKVLNKFPEVIREFLKNSHRDLEEILSGRIAASLP